MSNPPGSFGLKITSHLIRASLSWLFVPLHKEILHYPFALHCYFCWYFKKLQVKKRIEYRVLPIKHKRELYYFLQVPPPPKYSVTTMVIITFATLLYAKHCHAQLEHQTTLLKF